MSQRRRGGFRGPELRGTLGTLLRSTLQQAGVVRDALERGAREGRSRLDEMRQDRRRHDALAELGETVLELIRAGEIDVAELPEVGGLVRELDELDDDHGGRGGGRRDRDDDRDELPRDIAPPPSRSRFDGRGSDRLASRAPARGPAARNADDGTVSSSRWAPLRAAAATATAAAARVWRPPADHAAPDHAADAPETPRRPARGIADPLRKGGISFDDDDLAEYMHPDDVPPKPSDDES